jgi:dTDP-glucose 4,6-dehydratase
MLSGKGEVLMGDPAPIRDFLYIDDEVDAYIKVIETEKDIFGEIMNTGTGRGVSVRELVEIIGKMVDFKGEVKWCQRSLRPFEIKKLIVDTEKIRRLLGWSPRYTLEEGLKRTIEWWRNYLDRDCKRR